MILLSAIVALLTAGMAATHVGEPRGRAALRDLVGRRDERPRPACRARIFVFLRMFIVGYAVAFALFAVGFIVFGTGGLPDWAPGWMQTLQPQPFLALAFTIFAVIVLLIARLPLIAETIGLSDSYFASRDPSRLRGSSSSR